MKLVKLFVFYHFQTTKLFIHLWIIRKTLVLVNKFDNFFNKHSDVTSVKSTKNNVHVCYLKRLSIFKSRNYCIELMLKFCMIKEQFKGFKRRRLTPSRQNRGPVFTEIIILWRWIAERLKTSSRTCGKVWDPRWA